MNGKCKWVSHLSGSDYAVFYRKGTNHTIAVPPIALEPQQEVRMVQVQVDPLPVLQEEENNGLSSAH